MIPKLSTTHVSTSLLKTETLIAAIPIGHKLASTDELTMELLANEPFIMYEPEAGAGIYNQIVGMCQTAGFTPHISQHARHMPTIVSLVAAGMGVSLVSPAMKRMNLGRVCYRELATHSASTAITTETRTDLLLAHRTNEISMLIQNFIDAANESTAR